MNYTDGEVPLPPRDYVPPDLVGGDEEEGADAEEFEACEDCIAPLTCRDFKRCICEDNT